MVEIVSWDAMSRFLAPFERLHNCAKRFSSFLVLLACRIRIELRQCGVSP